MSIYTLYQATKFWKIEQPPKMKNNPHRFLIYYTPIYMVDMGDCSRDPHLAYIYVTDMEKGLKKRQKGLEPQ